MKTSFESVNFLCFSGEHIDAAGVMQLHKCHLIQLTAFAFVTRFSRISATAFGDKVIVNESEWCDSVNYRKLINFFLGSLNEQFVIGSINQIVDDK